MRTTSCNAINCATPSFNRAVVAVVRGLKVASVADDDIEITRLGAIDQLISYASLGQAAFSPRRENEGDPLKCCIRRDIDFSMRKRYMRPLNPRGVHWIASIIGHLA